MAKEQNEDMFLEVWVIQELAECMKWLADTQQYLGTKEEVDLFNGDKACGAWYIARINQNLAETIVEKSEKIMKDLV